MKNQKTKKYSAAFTLVELLVVLAIIGIMASIAINSLIISNRQQLFLNQFEEVFSAINNARSLAISGKGELDYVDYDQDGCNYTGALPCTNGADYVTPANYGVRFDSTGTGRVRLFADMQVPLSGATGAELQYDNGTTYTTGHDLVLRDVVIDSRFQMEVFYGNGSLTQDTLPASIFYSPLYADIKFQDVAVDQTNPFFVVRLRELTGVQRCRQIKIHQLAGVPEVGACI
jgi:prepilin-type N-terminal cleavage/methylation domain-containing protein